METQPAAGRIELPHNRAWWLWLIKGVVWLVLVLHLRYRCDRRALRLAVQSGRPLVIVFNHTSYLDVPAVGLGVGARLMQKMVLPGKQELFRGGRFWLWVLAASGVIPVKRDHSDTAAVRVLLRALQSGRHVMLAPEGTRSDDGRAAAFPSGFVRLAHKAGALIVPVGITGAYEAMPRGVDFPRRGRLAAHFGEPFDPQAALPPRPTQAELDAYAEQVRQRVCALSDQVCDPVLLASAPGAKSAF